MHSVQKIRSVFEVCKHQQINRNCVIRDDCSPNMQEELEEQQEVVMEQMETGLGMQEVEEGNE